MKKIEFKKLKPNTIYELRNGVKFLAVSSDLREIKALAAKKLNSRNDPLAITKIETVCFVTKK